MSNFINGFEKAAGVELLVRTYSKPPKEVMKRYHEEEKKYKNGDHDYIDSEEDSEKNLGRKTITEWGKGNARMFGGESWAKDYTFDRAYGDSISGKVLSKIEAKRILSLVKPKITDLAKEQATWEQATWKQEPQKDTRSFLGKLFGKKPAAAATPKLEPWMYSDWEDTGHQFVKELEKGIKDKKTKAIGIEWG